MSVISVSGVDDDGLVFTGKYVSGIPGRVFWKAVFSNRGKFIGNRSGEIRIGPKTNAHRTLEQVMRAIEKSWGPGL
ncbi:hypothetical protein DYST_00322 [Dyella terrae]|nr:hypothetical protein DYST_00322 [Dyella terrae]